ncbi:cupin domain-containing protein [Streptomyces sp. NPDC050315]|uniref:(R)-mandelonitrile lyase n=1 Tax=Streptomyces sp. NPDC050315 TaxID=3155039 RepID=UPI003442291D
MKAIRRTGAAVLAGVAGSAILLTGCSTDTGPAAGADTTRAASAEPASATSEPGIVVSRDEDRDSVAGAPDNFTGKVSIQPLYTGDENSEGASDVRFTAGARTVWHTHPDGQRLLITEGTGWVQEWGKKRITVHEGDVVWFAPGVKHWHGATSDSAMAHTAITYAVDGVNVEWLEHVTDDQYESGKQEK